MHDAKVLLDHQLTRTSFEGIERSPL